MSEILSNIVVEQSNINFSPDNNNLNITPEAIQLNIFTGASPGAGQSNSGELLYNNVNLVDGVPFTSYANGVLTLGSNANISITGGTNGYVLQTDGTGNLSWAVGTGNITGNGIPGGSINQIQYNLDGANFGGSAGFTFNPSSNLVSMPGNLAASGTITAVNITANTGIFTGNGSGLSSLTASNITGQVANALVASTVYTAAQPNITSVGTLTNVTVSGNVIAGNVYANSGTIGANLLSGTLTTVSQPNITSVGTLTNLTVGGTTTIQQALEKVTTNATGSTGTINFDVLTQAILLKTSNATANFTINIRGNSTTTLNAIMSDSQSLTCTFINTNGSTGYYANLIQIDGSNITPLWVTNGEPTIGTINGKDVYSFNIIKTASNTYTVFGTFIGYD